MSFHLITWLRYLSHNSPDQWLIEGTKERVLEITNDFRHNNLNIGAFFKNEPRD